MIIYQPEMFKEELVASYTVVMDLFFDEQSRVFDTMDTYIDSTISKRSMVEYCFLYKQMIGYFERFLICRFAPVEWVKYYGENSLLGYSGKFLTYRSYHLKMQKVGSEMAKNQDFDDYGSAENARIVARMKNHSY